MIFVLQCLRAWKEKAVCSGGCWITNEWFALGLNDKQPQSRLVGRARSSAGTEGMGGGKRSSGVGAATRLRRKVRALFDN